MFHSSVSYISKREHKAPFSISTASNLQEVLHFYAPGNYKRGEENSNILNDLRKGCSHLKNTDLECMQLNNTNAFSSKRSPSCNARVCAHIEDYLTRLKSQLFILSCPLLQILPLFSLMCVPNEELLLLFISRYVFFFFYY